ncbi:cobalamin B12-binding domain-containing protein [Streptomyces sp. NPDC050560]|uniref:cobalamin B12-binding domain-containing protein n=1 Tax=Streptomyces sp. NPDC050560 TaxID=3365630 RepID=UPI00379CBDE7
MNRTAEPSTLLLSGVSSDSHTWNLVYLELLLREHGHRVRNLGACVPVGLVVDTARRERPGTLVVSSVNGHGADDGERLIRALRAVPLLAALPAVIGGKLGTTGHVGAAERRRRLRRAGFDDVFEGPDALPRLLDHLRPADPAPPRRATAGGGTARRD